MCSRPGCDLPPAGRRGYCRECRNAYQREWRRTHPLSEDARLKDICRSYTGVLIRRGRLLRKPCQTCGAEPAQAHNPDYRDPRWVLWFCPQHHRETHQMIARLLVPRESRLTVQLEETATDVQS